MCSITENFNNKKIYATEKQLNKMYKNKEDTNKKIAQMNLY